MTEVEVNRVYLVGVKFPGCLNNPSPAKAIPYVGELFTKDADATARNVCGIHRHVALVLQYNAITHVAVIFLGSTQPRYPQRYVPWQGSPRLPYQTTEVLHIDGGPLPRAGYLNFSHALRVLVIQENEMAGVIAPGLASVNHLVYRGGDTNEVMCVVLQDGDIDTLKSFHALYWEGARYDRDGYLLGGHGGGGGRAGASHSTSYIASRFPVGSSYQASGTTMGSTNPNPGSIQGSGQEVFSYKVDEALRWNELRNQQIDLLEGEGDFDVEDLPCCVIEAPTLEGWNRAGHGLQYDVLCSP